ncbi:hypothetical protein [Streptomyces sp. NPDC093089]|uniref:hypothetical protein n=1 Tax=Streptomyces sp. NPDC093089 TaxID=3366024 RepID=UPI003808E8B2
MGKEQVHAVLACGGEDADDPGSDNGGDVELMAAAFDRDTGALERNVPIDARHPVPTGTGAVIELSGDYGQIDAAEVVGERMYALAWAYFRTPQEPPVLWGRRPVLDVPPRRGARARAGGRRGELRCPGGGVRRTLRQ